MHCIRLFLLIIFTAFNFACASNRAADSESKTPMPKTILWAWERAEDLRFIDSQKYGVAFLAETLVLQNDKVDYRPRRQPLKVSPNTFLIAVTRIETDKTNRPALSESQKAEIVSLVRKTLELPRVKAVQIDFDVVVSERAFYKSLMESLKKELPAATPLSMTALASWCASDNWMSDFPVDEAVPMAFQMGADDQTIRTYLADDNDWREPLCQNSYGIALDEPLKTNFKSDRHFFVFNSRAWRAEDLSHLPEGAKP